MITMINHSNAMTLLGLAYVRIKVSFSLWLIQCADVQCDMALRFSKTEMLGGAKPCLLDAGQHHRG